MREPTFGKTGSGRREEQDVAAGVCFEILSFSCAQLDWAFAMVVTAKQITRAFIYLNSPGVILLL